jgi:release factor glutamine methyltransferase
VIPTLDPSVKDHEPILALDGGEDGLDFYRAILDRFSPKVCFIFEIGYDQREDIMALANERGMVCEVTRDYGGNDRVAFVSRP